METDEREDGNWKSAPLAASTVLSFSEFTNQVRCSSKEKMMFIWSMLTSRFDSNTFYPLFEYFLPSQGKFPSFQSFLLAYLPFQITFAKKPLFSSFFRSFPSLLSKTLLTSSCYSRVFSSLESNFNVHFAYAWILILHSSLSKRRRKKVQGNEIETRKNQEKKINFLNQSRSPFFTVFCLLLYSRNSWIKSRLPFLLLTEILTEILTKKTYKAKP